MAIRCRFVDRFAGSSVPSRVSGQRFSAHDAPLPSAGSRRVRFPAFTGCMGALRLPARASGSLILFGCRSHALLPCSCSPKRSRRSRRTPLGLEHCSAGVPLSGFSRPWTRAGSHRFPGDPSHAFALLLDPGRAAETSPLAVSSTPPPIFQHRRPQREPRYRGSLTRLQHPPSTLRERRRHPRARLASGWRAAPLPGGRRTLWIAAKGFKSHVNPPFQVLACRDGNVAEC